MPPLSTRRLNAQTWYLIGSLILVLLWAAGQVARDSTWLSGLCFYIPSAFPAALMIGGSVVCARKQRWRTAACAACLALPPLGVFLFVENHWSSRSTTFVPSQFRVVHWNVAGHLERLGAREVLVANRADLYVLSEITDPASVDALREALGPAYRAEVFGNLAVVGAGIVRADGWLIDRHRMKVQKVIWNSADRSVVLLVVDLPSEISVHRDPLLREVNELIEKHRPDLVIGDFNAPRRSWALCELPPGYRHAYDTAGAGFGNTWPVPVPMYSLDHCLHSAEVSPIQYALHTSRHSDHRLQVFDFACKKSDE